MLLNEKKYSTLRSIYYNEIKKVRENPNLNEEEKAVLIKINQRRIELLNEEARALNLYKDLFEEVAWMYCVYFIEGKCDECGDCYLYEEFEEEEEL